MIQENSFEETDPKDIEANDQDIEETEDSDEGYDILPSNGPGLAGDDGEQVIDELEEDDLEEDEEDDAEEKDQ